MNDLVIVRMEKARAELAEAKTIQATKKILDIAGAAEIYAKRQQLGEEAISYAHAVKIEALAQLGDMLKGMEKQAGGRGLKGGGRNRGSTKELQLDAPPTLEELGIDKKTSMIAQQLSALPEEIRQEIVERETSLKTAQREAKRAEVKEAAALPADTYRVLYADPPWKYGDKCDSGAIQSGGAEMHYPSMTIQELCAMPIKELAQDDAVLFLWVTSPLLYEAFPIIEAWGFKYKACFVWDKVKHNMGHYNSVRHEFLLVCTRGSCQPDETKLFDSVQSIERSKKHSEKPQEFRDIIDTLYPHGKRLELFARQAHEGWEAWGNESV